MFRRHIKPKKKHEIVRMADVATMLASKVNVKDKESTTRFFIFLGTLNLFRMNVMRPEEFQISCVIQRNPMLNYVNNC